MDGEPIRVAFDQRIFLRQKFGGISRYFVELVRNLSGFGIDPAVFAPFHMSSMLEEVGTFGLIGKRIEGARIPVALARRLGVAATPLYALLTGRRIVHETYFGPTRVTPPGGRTVITVHDMINELFPEQFGPNPGPAWKAASIARADRIVCVSENTRRDLIQFFPDVADRTVTIHLGTAQLRFHAAAGHSSARQRPYVLFVGPRDYAYKNFNAFVEAFAESHDLRDDFEVVCVGPKFTEVETERFRQLGLAGKISAVQPNDEELAGLYAHAAVFVYPSLYEGFGIPPLEAMAAGCPVIAMPCASIPEVCGDAAHYCADTGPHGIGQAMIAVISNSDHAEYLRLKGRARVGMMTWGACAASHAEVYRELGA